MIASEYGHTNIVQLLLEHGADANLRNKVSSSANIVCVSVCLAAVCLAFSTTNWYYVVVQLKLIARYISYSCFLTNGIY